MGTHESSAKVIGILALQGDFDAHRKTLADRVGVPTRLVRTIQDLQEVDALILPGGESTTVATLMVRVGLDAAIKTRVAAGMPAFGTCAGMILLASKIEGYANQPTLGVMDIEVARNAFGRQVDSFEADIPLRTGPGAESVSVRGVFIRAPYVTRAASNIEVLSHFRDKIVGVRQGNVIATAFHPELTDDGQVHAYFVEIVQKTIETGRD